MSNAAALECVERGDLEGGLAKARLALAEDPNAGLTIAWIELERGNRQACESEIAKAVRRGASPGRAKCLNGLRLCALGSYELAVRELSNVDLSDDLKWQANALVGLGIARTYLFRLDAADRDFAAAAEILAALGEDERVATCVHNRGFVALQAGDVPKALALFDQAAGGLRRGRAEALIDRASALIAAGMTRDASALLDEAQNLLAGRASRLAEAALTAGYCALRAGDTDLAAREAQRARTLFRQQRRPAWTAAADALALRTRPIDVAAALRTADRCLRWGRRTEAAELLVAAAQTAPQAEARELLTRVQAERHAETPRLRALGWLARARLAPDNRGLFAACRAGLRQSPDLAHEFTATALRAARRPRTVLAAAEPRAVDVIDALDDRALVRFAVRDGELLACTVVNRRVRVHCLGPAAGLRAAVAALRMNPAVHAKSVEEKLFAPLRLGDRPLVLVPVEAMSGLVWPELPSCAGRPVSVAPTATAWLQAAKADRGDGTVSVAGPDLTHAEREVSALRHTTRLHGRRSTVANTLRAIEGADIAHIAAHGRFRDDAPMYSYLELADGPLHGHDLTNLTRAPRLLILSACEVARAEVFATAILDRGAQALIASSLPVPDDKAVDLITTFCARLRAGDTPAPALAHAQDRHGHLGFTCIGAG
ncbi:CHAT domain-containing protein [Actinocrispum sp. NPDC049592]|uniref:CHAT domain-containing protein n=1 Tax=Actinocrispum sp. NPDC049592 TaxID=3154835 RepID=UPI00341ED38C